MSVRPQSFGLWHIAREEAINRTEEGRALFLAHVGWPTQTVLRRFSARSIHLSMPEIVMEESLHGAGSWDADPEVVAMTFAVHRMNIDDFLMKKAA